MNSDGAMVYSDVIMMMHVDTHNRVTFQTIHTASGMRVTLTPGHLIYKSGSNSSLIHHVTPSFAQDVHVGDYIYNAQAEPLRVIDIETSVRIGDCDSSTDYIINNHTC